MELVFVLRLMSSLSYVYRPFNFGYPPVAILVEVISVGIISPKMATDSYWTKGCGIRVA